MIDGFITFLLIREEEYWKFIKKKMFYVFCKSVHLASWGIGEQSGLSFFIIGLRYLAEPRITYVLQHDLFSLPNKNLK